ncbi:MAG: glycosyltransferase family 4 protein, partial [Crenarchaeota archaeon]|nr:glycosyltransferase family 4 protein [Thermoproteota archaeon]
MSRVLFLANHFITLYSFRKELIRKLVDEGHELYLSLPASEENKYFEDLGCKIIPTEIDRRGVNPIKDLKLIKHYRKIIQKINPDIIFSYTIKPNIYGSIASNKTHHNQVCNITGTGSAFIKKNLLSVICKTLYKISVKKSYKVFFQNSGDRDFFIKNKMVGNNYEMLPGSGCNLEDHAYSSMPNDDVIKFIFIGRVMKLKGIDEYLDCAKTIKQKYPNTMFYIAGWNEEEKYKAIVEDYEKKGFVEYIGFRKDISDWIKNTHCTILPSQGGEGVPNVLLESAATGRVCIGSKIPGTVDIIDDGITGYLFETGNTQSLIEQVEKFINLPTEKKEQMGVAGRKKIEKEFDRTIVINKYLNE